MELETLLNVLRAFERHDVDYVLIGGVALNLLGIIRVTEDVDFFIRPAPENVERVKQALRSVWDDPELDTISSEDVCGEYPTIRYGPPGEDFVIDLLSRLGEAFRFGASALPLQQLPSLSFCRTPAITGRDDGR